METINPFFLIILVVFAILQIILFFKLWGMTNDSRVIRKHLDRSEKRYYLAHHPEIAGWANGVTEEEKIDALDLIQGLGKNQVIVKDLNSGDIECWGIDYWESTERGKKAKLIYQLSK